MIFVIAFLVLVALLVVFHGALAGGAPWGRLAWGGQQPGTLTRPWRVASALVAVVCLVVIVLALDRARLIDVVPNGVSGLGMWVAFALFTINVPVNAVSRSKPQRFIVAPVMLALAVLALAIALTSPTVRAYDGMVIDSGTGPRLCSLVMESHPPQCGIGSPSLTPWDWNAVPHEAEQGVRWGRFAFSGEQQAEQIRVLEDPTALP